MKKCCMLSILLLVLSVKAEHSGPMMGEFKVLSYLSVGPSKFQIDNLNKKISDLGYVAFPREAFTIGLGNTMAIQNLVLDMEIASYFWRTRPDELNNRQSGLWGGSAILNMGVNFNSAGSSFQFSPYAGAGIYLLKLTLNPKSIEFQNAVSQAPVGPFWMPTIVLDAGLSMNYTFRVGEREIFSLGAKGGFIFDPSENSPWYANGIRIDNAPDTRLSGPYVRLTIGKGAYKYY